MTVASKLDGEGFIVRHAVSLLYLIYGSGKNVDSSLTHFDHMSNKLE
jgi:hypothetical protein